MTGEVTTYYLEMLSPDQLDAKDDARGLVLVETKTKQFQFNRFLYHFIGEPWEWVDKLAWSDEQWRSWAEAESVRTWVAYHAGTPAGYFELEFQGEGDVEITYFGLAGNFIGRGFGGYLLSQAIRKAWQWEGVKRVWLHTCSLDHPSALANYKARGLKVYRTSVTGEA